MVKYYKNGSQFKEKPGYYVNWITSNPRFGEKDVLPVLVMRLQNGGASHVALKQLDQGFYAASIQYVKKASEKWK